MRESRTLGSLGAKPNGRATRPFPRYAIGAVVREVKGAPERYGAGAVIQLASTTGEDVATLYRYATVAGCGR